MNRLSSKQQLAATAVSAAFVALLLYWPILTLPLAFDDLLHIRLVKGLDYLSVWLPNEDFSFYRPVLFLPVLLTRSLFGNYPSTFVYGMNLLLHSLNAALLTWLIFRVWQRWSRALTAGLLFATLPFSYQAVAFFGNNIYPILVFLMVLMLHSYLQGLQGGKRWWLATAVFFLFGLLTHELMVIFGFLAAFMQWAYHNRIEWSQWRQHHFQPNAILRASPYLLFIFTGALYILLYQILPISGEIETSGANLVQPKILYFLQAIVYPLAGLFNQLLHPQTIPLVVGSFALMLLATLWVARKPENRFALLFGWGWWGIIGILLFLTLPADYLLRGPRLLYLNGIGAVLVWAVLLDTLFAWRRVGRYLWVVTLTIILLFSSSFVREKVAALQNLGAPIKLIQEIMPERPLAEGVLLVNFPQYRSPVQNTFPVGVEHLAIMGHHIFAEEIVWENLNQVRPVLAVAAPELLYDPGYPFGTHVQSDLSTPLPEWAPAGAHVFISQFTEDGVQASYTGQLSPMSQESTPLAQFGDYSLLAATAVFCDEAVTTELTWKSTGTPPASASIFAQALSADGRVIGQQDGPPLRLRPDQINLPANWQIIDRRELAVAAGTQPAQLLLGVYDFMSGERFTAVDKQQKPLPDNALSVPITTCP